MKKLIGLYLLFFATQIFASAMVTKDDFNKTITLRARLVFSGPALTEQIAQDTINEINTMWTKKNGKKIVFRGTTYKIKFHIDHMIRQGLLFDFKIAPYTKSCALNFIEFRHKEIPDDISYYNHLGSQGGVFYTEDKPGHSTTAAHEFGHGLMLNHNDFNETIEADVPGIMFARGSAVKAQFQWNPKALPGEKGSTINPIYRVVRDSDIDDIPLEKTEFVSGKNYGCLGDGLPFKLE